MKRRTRLSLLLLFLALIAPIAPAVHSQTAVAAKTADIPRLDFEKYTLGNGLTVILREDHRLPLVAVNLWYHVGPANERPGLTGFAHLFEHMMFQGSKHIADDAHFKILEGAGATDINGTTDFDRTNYFETLPSNQLELALWLESDRMGFLLDKLDQGKLSNQQDVVRNERRQSVENQPFGVADEEVYHLAYPKGHPYYAAVIGSHEDIQAAKLEDVKAFFKTYYAPNNASLAIVGDIDTAKTKQLVEKHFGSLMRSAAPAPKIDVKTPPIPELRRAVVTDRLELARLAIAWLDPSIYTPGDAEGDLMARVLGAGKSSRLYKDLVYNKRIAQEVAVQHQSLMLGSLFYIQATAAPGHKLEELEAAIDAQIEKVRSEPISARELDAARNAVESQIIRGLETLGGFGGVADRLNQYNHYLNDPGYLERDILRYRQVGAAALLRYAQTYLKKNAEVVVYGVPGEQKLGTPPPPLPPANPQSGAESVNADEPWRATRPAPGAPSKVSFPTPRQFKLANGLTVLLAERHDLPIVSANLTVRTGSEANPPQASGLANFTVVMLDEGTATRSSLELAADVEQIGAQFNTVSSVDASGLRVRFLKKNAAAAMDLLADVALHPSFPPAEVERLRQQRLASILQEREDPQIEARKTLSEALYGPAHPYGYREIGTEASNKSLAVDTMRAFWKKYFVPSNTALILAGDVAEAEARAWAEKHFGAWAGPAPEPPAVGTPATTDSRVIIVDKPGAQQTVVEAGIIAAARSSPDYVPLRVMNAALGGMFSSRINMNLREKHGYTYGAFSGVVFYKHPGLFLAGSAIRTDVTAPAIKEMLSEIAGVAAGGITDEELRLSRDFIARSLPGLFETTPRMAQAVEQLSVYGLPLDYYTQLPARVDAVTPADVKRVGGSYLHPDRLVIVAVGDRAKIEAPIRALNLGKIEVRAAEPKSAK